MGTPEFAVPSLKILLENNYDIVAVVTAPDKPRGRGQSLAQSAVKTFALDHNLPVLQPENLRSTEFTKVLHDLKADLQIVVAFRMLPNIIWAMPRLGTVNLHASLLPNYRGAAPINWVVINGETETGLTTFFIEEKMDTGNIIFQETQPIYETDTAGTLHNRMMLQGANLVLKTVKTIETGSCMKYPQIATPDLKLAPKIHKENCEINTTLPAEYLINFVKGLAPKPGAFIIIDGTCYKIFSASKLQNTETIINQGQIITDNETYLAVGTATDMLSIDIIQQSGKKPMTIKAFLQGNKFSEKFLTVLKK